MSGGVFVGAVADSESLFKTPGDVINVGLLKEIKNGVDLGASLLFDHFKVTGGFSLVVVEFTKRLLADGASFPDWNDTNGLVPFMENFRARLLADEENKLFIGLSRKNRPSLNVLNKMFPKLFEGLGAVGQDLEDTEDFVDMFFKLQVFDDKTVVAIHEFDKELQRDIAVQMYQLIIYYAMKRLLPFNVIDLQESTSTDVEKSIDQSQFAQKSEVAILSNKIDMLTEQLRLLLEHQLSNNPSKSHDSQTDLFKQIPLGKSQDEIFKMVEDGLKANSKLEGELNPFDYRNVVSHSSGEVGNGNQHDTELIKNAKWNSHPTLCAAIMSTRGSHSSVGMKRPFNDYYTASILYIWDYCGIPHQRKSIPNSGKSSVNVVNPGISTVIYNPEGDVGLSSLSAQAISKNLIPATHVHQEYNLSQQIQKANLSVTCIRFAEGYSNSQMIYALFDYQRLFRELVYKVLGGTPQNHIHHITNWTVLLIFHLNLWNEAIMTTGDILQCLVKNFHSTWDSHFKHMTELNESGHTWIDLKSAMEFLEYRCESCNKLGCCSLFCTNHKCGKTVKNSIAKIDHKQKSNPNSDSATYWGRTTNQPTMKMPQLIGAWRKRDQTKDTAADKAEYERIASLYNSSSKTSPSSNINSNSSQNVDPYLVYEHQQNLIIMPKCLDAHNRSGSY